MTRSSAACNRLALLLLPFAFFGLACRQLPPKDLGPIQEPTSTEQFDIDPYLRAARLGRWTYMRTDPEDERSATTFVRLFGPERLMEGNLVFRDFLPIEQYLEPPGPASQPAGHKRPKAPLEGGTAFMFELFQPLQPFPSGLQPGTPIVESTPIVYFEYDGRRLSRGTLTRKVQIEGFETVNTPAGEFADCLRLRLDLTVEVSWTVKMDWISYMWLSAEKGEVRRIEQMSGWFLVFWFSSEHEYQLISASPVPRWPPAEELRPPLWKYGAVLMDRVVPRPRITGMVVDYADPPSPGTQPATAPAETPPAAATMPSAAAGRTPKAVGK